MSISPSNPTQCYGSNVTFTPTTTGTAAFNYQWNENGSIISGQTNSTLALSSLTTGNSGSYTCAVTNACGSVTSSSSSLTVDGQLTAGTVSSNQTICSSGTLIH